MNTIRTNIQNLAMMSAVIAFASCESHRKAEIVEGGTEVVEVRTPHEDTLDKAAEPEMKTESAKGIVKAVNFGKDGYTAEMETEQKSVYFATVSRSNLKDPGQYKESKVGETIEVTGDLWKNAEGQNQITVREMH